jgi:uncharacterized cysteine cluster protein YcgN (CxxCxxCC family)
MREVSILCDRCGQVVIEHRTEIRVESGPLRELEGVESADLCLDCGEALLSFFRERRPALAGR